MKLKALISVAVAAAFLAPFAAQASATGDRLTIAQAQPPASEPAASSSGMATGSSGTDRSADCYAEFERLDKDHNGSLSRAEVEGTRFSSRFAELDTNNDSRLSHSEACAADATSGSSGATKSGATRGADTPSSGGLQGSTGGSTGAAPGSRTTPTEPK